MFLASCKNETYYQGKGVVIEEDRTYLGGVQVKVSVDTAGDGNQICFWTSPAGLADSYHSYSQGDTVDVEWSTFNSWVGPVTEKSKQDSAEVQ